MTGDETITTNQTMQQEARRECHKAQALQHRACSMEDTLGSQLSPRSPDQVPSSDRHTLPAGTHRPF
jgi:hypothetical protein